jgi:hypothetical protein
MQCPGDMQLTKAEIAETQIIVTTPEKWDVVTRKPTGEGEVAAVSRAFSPLRQVSYQGRDAESQTPHHRRNTFAER